MTGGVRKRGKTWSYYFDIGIIDGKRKKKEKGGFRTKKDAEKGLADALVKYNATGTAFEPSNISFADFLEKYFCEYVVVNLRYNSQTTIRETYDKHLIPYFREFKLKAITPALLQDFLNQLKINGYSKSTISYVSVILNSAFNYAVEPCGLIASNPMQNVRKPKMERTANTVRVLSADEWQKIISLFPVTDRFHIPLMIGYYCGLRISETCALTWNDIDMNNRTITVNKQLLKRKTSNGYGWYFDETKTAHSTRTVKFGDTLFNALTETKRIQEGHENVYKTFYNVQYATFETDATNNTIKRINTVQSHSAPITERIDFVCVDENGKMLTPDTLKYVPKTVRDKIGIQFNFHALRHTHATMLIEGGISPKTVQSRLGHSNITTTLQIYVHATEQMDTDAVDVFERQTKNATEK